MTEEQRDTLRKHLDNIKRLLDDGYVNLTPGWQGGHSAVFEAIEEEAYQAMKYIDDADTIN